MADPPTHFFKFIPPGFKFDISIPSSFLATQNHGRLSKVKLKRGRHEWSVDIDDGVFGDGWRRFVKENGVQEFDFIVFKHQGGMVFDFLVFDQSTCERQYPNLLDEMDVEEPVTESDTICTYESLKKLKKPKRSDDPFQDREKCQVKKERGSAMKKKSSLTPNNPFFISNLKPYNFNSSALHIPFRFSSPNDLKNGDMILRDDKGRSWEVQLKRREEKFLYIGRGITTFLVENGLKVGDAFKFELVEKEKDKPLIANISCIHHGGFIPCKEDDCPYFMGKLKSYNIQKSDLYLPQEFVRSSGLINKKNIYLKNAEGERLWKVKLRNYKSSYYIGGGWKEFRVANGLKEGDSFKLEVFEKGEKPIVNFYLQKKTIKTS